jgi:hypothetical protein
MRSKKARWILKVLIVIPAIFYAYMGLSMLTGKGFFGIRPSIAYQLTAKGRITVVELEPNKDGTTTIKNTETGETENVNLSEFVKTARFVPIRSEKRNHILFRTLAGLMVLIAAAGGLYAGFSSDYKRYRIRKLVAASSRET